MEASSFPAGRLADGMYAHHWCAAIAIAADTQVADNLRDVYDTLHESALVEHGRHNDGIAGVDGRVQDIGILAADDRTVGAQEEETPFVRIPIRAAGLPQIVDNPLVPFENEGVGVVDLALDCDVGRNVRNDETVAILQRDVGNRVDFPAIWSEIENDTPDGPQGYGSAAVAAAAI